MADDVTCTAEDDKYMMDDPTLTARTKIAIDELRRQQSATYKLSPTDFNALDELTEELVVAAAQRLLNVPPVTLCSNGEQSSFNSHDISMDSSEMKVPWIVIPSVLDKLLEFE